jgi:hypothetical protein
MDSECGIMMDEGLDGRGTSSMQCSDPYPMYSPGVKRLGREADHSFPSIAEVNTCSYRFTSPMRIQGLLLKYRDNLSVLTKLD